MTKVDIDTMTSNEWLDYREGLLEGFYARGNVLKPNINCKSCDPDEDYTCFACECVQLNQD